MDGIEISFTSEGKGFIASVIVDGEKFWAYGDTRTNALGELMMTEGLGIRIKDFSNLVEPPWHKQAMVSARSAAAHRQKR